MKHHILGPSSLPRVLNCPGSLYGPPVEDPGSAAAEEGTVCHSLLEFCLSFNENPRTVLGSTEFHPDYPISLEMVEGVELFLDTVDSVCREFSIPRHAVMSERKLVHPAIPNDMFGGTSDCIIAGDDTLVVMDLKFGRRQVFANSWQLTAYSLLSLAHLERTFRKVVQIIVQPRGNPQVDRHEPGAYELADVWDRISDVAKYLLDNPELHVPRPDILKAGEWCKYCKRREGCPARLAMVGEITDAAMMPVPQIDGTTKVLSTPAAEFTTEQLTDWMSKFDVLREFMQDVKLELVKRAGRGEKIPGHKLLVKYANRSWVIDDEDKMRKKLPRAGLGLSAKDVMVSKLASVAQVERILKAREDWPQIREKFEALYESKPVGVKLANARAKGVEVQPEALAELLQNMKDEAPDE